MPFFDGLNYCRIGKDLLPKYLYQRLIMYKKSLLSTHCTVHQHMIPFSDYDHPARTIMARHQNSSAGKSCRYKYRGRKWPFRHFSQEAHPLGTGVQKASGNALNTFEMAPGKGRLILIVPVASKANCRMER